jgi:hypothetical protein
MSDTSDFCRIIQIMWNTDNIESRIRLHPSDIHIKNEYKNKYPYYSLRYGKGRSLGQRHGLQSATFTSYFYKNNY